MNLGTSNSKEYCDSEDIRDDDSDDKVDGDGVALATGVVEQRHKCSSKSNICALQCSVGWRSAVISVMRGGRAASSAPREPTHKTPQWGPS